MYLAHWELVYDVLVLWNLAWATFLSYLCPTKLTSQFI